MSDELQVLRIVAERLDGLGIGYMVTGSMAMNYYAVPRMTRDIDLVVDVGRADTDRLVDALEPDFYVDRAAAVRAVGERGLFNVIHGERVVKVDFVVRKNTEYRRLEFSRRRRVRVDDWDLWLVAPEDLILSKLDWAHDSRSEIQLGDVRNLLAAGLDLDRAHLARWAERLGLGALYREVGG